MTGLLLTPLAAAIVVGPLALVTVWLFVDGWRKGDFRREEWKP